MKKNRQQLPVDHTDGIARVIEEFLDWKDVYESQITDGKVGVVIFAANFKGDVFILWRLENTNTKVGDKTTYCDESNNELAAQIVWVDKQDT